MQRDQLPAVVEHGAAGAAAESIGSVVQEYSCVLQHLVLLQRHLLVPALGMLDDIGGVSRMDGERIAQQRDETEARDGVLVDADERIVESALQRAGDEHPLRLETHRRRFHRPVVGADLEIEDAPCLARSVDRMDDVVVGQQDVRGDEKAGAEPSSGDTLEVDAVRLDLADASGARRAQVEEDGGQEVGRAHHPFGNAPGSRGLAAALAINPTRRGIAQYRPELVADRLDVGDGEPGHAESEFGGPANLRRPIEDVDPSLLVALRRVVYRPRRPSRLRRASPCLTRENDLQPHAIWRSFGCDGCPSR